MTSSRDSSDDRVWKDDFSFITGTARYHDLAYFALISDSVSEGGLSQSVITAWDDGVWEGDADSIKDWDVVGAATALAPLEQAVFLGPTGEVYCVGSGESHDESVRSDSDQGRSGLLFRGLGSVGERLYAVGMGRQVYIRDSKGVWGRADRGTERREGDAAVVGFEAIDGFGYDEVYAVGWEGEIWCYDGTEWQPMGSPTNLVLTSVCCGNDGAVYIGGRSGFLIRGRTAQWESIDHGLFNADIWDVAWFQDRVYLSTSDALYSYHDGVVEPVNFGADPPETSFHLSAADGVLWSIGAKDVMSFDGSVWTRIE